SFSARSSAHYFTFRRLKNFFRKTDFSTAENYKVPNFLIQTQLRTGNFYMPKFLKLISVMLKVMNELLDLVERLKELFPQWPFW
ncbi:MULTISPECIES: hypothetical protein, partial [Escherichia]